MRTKEKLCEAVRKGDNRKIQKLLLKKRLFSKIDVNDFIMGKTLLFTASEAGKAESMLLLIKNGADINKGDEKGNPPIFVAAQNGHSEAVKLLLDSGVDPCGNSSLQAAKVAAQNGFVGIFNMLAEAGVNSMKRSFRYE